MWLAQTAKNQTSFTFPRESGMPSLEKPKKSQGLQKQHSDASVSPNKLSYLLPLESEQHDSIAAPSRSSAVTAEDFDGDHSLHFAQAGNIWLRVAQEVKRTDARPENVVAMDDLENSSKLENFETRIVSHTEGETRISDSDQVSPLSRVKDTVSQSATQPTYAEHTPLGPAEEAPRPQAPSEDELFSKERSVEAYLCPL
jgi:hypothetical protein